MTRAIDKVKHCHTMQDVRREVNALDDVLVPCWWSAWGYMTQAARIKQDLPRCATKPASRPSWTACANDPDRRRRRRCDGSHLPQPMEACIAYEHREFARLREPATAGSAA